MYTTIENHGFYTINTDSKEKYHELISKLSDKLPHGSGIDYNWFIHAYQYKGRIYLTAQNSFHAMDEYGGYCHIYNFKAKYLYNPIQNKPCEYCQGKGYRLLSEFQQYHPNMSLDDLITWLEKDRDITVYDDHTVLVFECNVCHGRKTLRIPEFELLPNRLVKGKELTCCGFGIDEYLSQALYLFSE